MTPTTSTGSVHRVSQSLTEVVRYARLAGADELERAVGLRVDAAGALILARLRPDTDTRLGDLADRLGLAPSTVSRKLAPSVVAGPVARHTDLDDGRVSLLHLTDVGRRSRTHHRPPGHPHRQPAAGLASARHQVLRVTSGISGRPVG